MKAQLEVVMLPVSSRTELEDRGVHVSETRHKDNHGGWRGGFRPCIDVLQERGHSPT
ncbi:hypothetical protein MSP7336_02460 [Mycobacterium shimoidei]|uniref:Uncharacterized protein n=1 Tax=Mycobacterium shimoidei TaxID=29313 RepID=A0A375YZF2_MYCSH|nr:hypothetical protein MSP7336_02460 [Mycobacterium shimoidei]